MRSALALVLLVAACGAAACTSVARREALDAKLARWHTLEVEAPSDRVLWKLTLLVLESQGFAPLAGSDPGARQVESGWKTDPQPFRGEGERRRALVRLTPLVPGRWRLEARVRCEHNQNLVSPLDPARAEWEPAPDDEAAARILLQHIRSRLQPELPLAPPAAEAR
jgi:hypothetical protein